MREFRLAKCADANRLCHAIAIGERVTRRGGGAVGRHGGGARRWRRSFGEWRARDTTRTEEKSTLF